MWFLIPILHPLTGITVPDPFLDIGSKSCPIVVCCDDCCCSFDTWMYGLSFGVKLTKNVLSEAGRNVDLDHIGPEWVYEFPTMRNRVTLSFLLKLIIRGSLAWAM